MDKQTRRMIRWLVLAGVVLGLWSGLVVVTPAQAQTLTPDLQITGKIVFESDRDGNSEIYVMNADGTNQTHMTNNAASDQNPTWSPDGTKIAFTEFSSRKLPT